MVGLLFMLVGTIGCWYFVLNRRVRENHSKALRSFFRLPKNQQDMFDASGFAAMLVAAICFTIFFFALLLMQIVRGFNGA
jgi:hypothetical protein